MARTPKHSLHSDTEAPQALPGEPTEYTQILMKLGQSERAILVMAEAIKTQMKVEHAFTVSPEMLGQVSSQIVAEILPMITAFQEEIHRLMSMAENVDGLQDLPDGINKAKANFLQEMAALKSSAIQELTKVQEEAITEIRAVANSGRNDVSDLATSASKLVAELKTKAEAARATFHQALGQVIADGRVALNTQVREVRTELKKSTAAAEAIHGRIGTTAASMEGVLDHLEYCNPALSTSAERRLKAVTRHAGLIQSAATVAGVAFVEMLLHVMGMR